MTSLFISYSRKDIDFAQKLTESLDGQELDFWIDWEGIPPTVDWWREIEKGIEEADNFLFLISPDSIVSEVCKQEIELAVRNGKRMVPIVVRDIESEEAPSELSPLNWIFIREKDEFEPAFNKLMMAINTDYEWVKSHRKLQVKALEWERSGHENSFLLRGKELQDAELQLVTNSSKEPRPTDLQRDYVFNSRRATDRQRRIITSVAIAGVIALAALAVFGFVQANLATNNAVEAQNQAATAEAASTLAVANEGTAIANAEEARRQANIARAGELAALALIEQDKHFDLALLFGLESFYTQETLRSKGTLFSLINSHPGLDKQLTEHSGQVNSVTFNPNGEVVASGGPGGIVLWDFSNPNSPAKLTTLQLTTLEADIFFSNALSVAFSSDGKTLAAGYFDINFMGNTNIPITTISLWDISNPTSPSQLATLQGDGNSVNSVAFSPDGETLASGGDDGIITLWDISDSTSPSQLSKFEGNKASNVNSVAFSPDGEILASGYWDNGVTPVNTIILWDVSDPSDPSQIATLNGHDGSVSKVAFSPDGETLASGGTDNTIILWDIGYPTNPVQLATLEGHDGSVNDLTFRQARKMLISGSSDKSVVLWDISEPTVPAQIAKLEGHSSSVNSVTLSRDGGTLVSGDDNTLIIWDSKGLTSPAKLATLEGNSYGGVNIISLSPDGETLASGGWDEIILWNISNPTDPSQLARLPAPSQLPSLQENFSGGRYHPIDVESVAISPDGKTLASGYSDWSNINKDDKLLNVIILWDISDPRSPSELAILEGHSESVSSIAFSPNGEILASGSWDDTIILWDINDPTTPSQLATLEVVDGSSNLRDINSVAFSPDGKTLASRSRGFIILWDVSHPTAPSQLAILEGHISILDVQNVAFSPNGKTLASGVDDEIILWDIRNLISPSQLSILKGHDDVVISVAFSPDGITLASGSDDEPGSSDNTLILWDISDLTTPKQLLTLEGAGSLVNSVTFSPSGKILASHSSDSTILWDLDPISWVKKACQRVGRNFTLAEWAQYFPGEEYRKTCEQWPLEPEVTVTSMPTP